MLNNSNIKDSYPNTNIYTQKAMWQNGKRVADTTAAANTKRAIFYCPIPPDFVFVGFDINPIAIGSTEAKGSNVSLQNYPGWFLLFIPRFCNSLYGYCKVCGVSVQASWLSRYSGCISSAKYSRFIALQLCCKSLGEERIGEPVFGADEVRNVNFENWDDLGWNDLGNTQFINALLTNISPTPNLDGIVFGSNSADMAFALYQKPSRVFIHANDML